MEAPSDVELTVPTGRVPSSRWPGTILAATIAAAIVAVGFLGGGTDRPAPPPSPRSSALLVRPVVDVDLVAPAPGAILETGRARVAGTAAPGTKALEVRILVDGVMVGRSSVVPRDGGFAADVPLLAPYGADPVAATIVISPVGRPGEPLVRREVTVRPASVVAVEEVSLGTGDDPVVVVRGTASLDVRRVSVEIQRGAAHAAGQATVGYRNDADFVEAVLGFGTGEWTVDVPIPFAAGPATVTVSWAGRRTIGETVLDVDLGG